MTDRTDELPDEEAIDFSPDLIAAQKAEADKRAREQAEHEDEEEDDDTGSFDDEDDPDADDEDDTSHAEGSNDDDDDDDLGDADRDDDDDDDASIARVPKVKKGEGGKRKKQTAQERIEELAEKRRIAEKGQYDAELKLVAMEKRLEALEKGGGGGGRPAPDLKKPDPKDYEYGSADDKYVDDMVNYRVALERADWEEENGQSAEEAREKDQIAHYKNRYAKTMADGEKKYGEKYKIVEDTNFPSELARDLLDSDRGVDIAYFFANNIGELRKVVTMTDAQRAKAIGRLEERFSASASAGKKRTKAPDTPSRKTTRRKQSQDDSRYGPDDQDEFDKAFWGR